MVRRYSGLEVAKADMASALTAHASWARHRGWRFLLDFNRKNERIQAD